MKLTKLSIAILAVLLATALFSCSQSSKKEDQTPAARGTSTYAAVTTDAHSWAAVNPTKRKIAVIGDTGSMLRVMDSSCVGLIEKVGENELLKVGNIYSYRTAERNIVHRLTSINSDGTLTFQGDSNDVADPSVNRNQVEYILVGILYTNGEK